MLSIPRLLLCTAVLCLSAAASAQAAISASTITTPSDRTFVLRKLGTQLTIAGTVTGTGAVDVHCYDGRGTRRPFALGVPTRNGAFSVGVLPPLIGSPAGACVLRAVPADTAPQSLTPFAGPRLGLTTFVARHHEGVPNEGHVFEVTLDWVLARGAGRFDGMDGCGTSRAGLIDPPSLAFSDTPARCLAYLWSTDDQRGVGSRSELLVDGENHFLAYHTVADELFDGSSDVGGAPSITAAVIAPSPDGATVGLDEHQPTVRCATNAFPPTAKSCGDTYRSGLVTARRETRVSDGGRTWTVTDRFESTDGRAHALDALYEHNWGPGTGFALPGESALTVRGEGFSRAVQPGPGSLVAGSPTAPAFLSQTWSANVEEFRVYDADDTQLRLRGTVPATGALETTFAFAAGASVDEVAAAAARARERLRGPVPAAPGATPAPETAPPAPPLAADAPRAVPAVRPDRAAPRLSRLSAGATAIRFRLGEAARVTARVEKAGAGRRSRTVRRVRRSLEAGVRRIALRRLRPGRYRLRLSAVDAAGNRTARTLRFRVVR